MHRALRRTLVPWHAVRWLTGLLFMRALVPAFMRAVQSSAWPRTWHRVVDRFARWTVQTPAVIIAAACCYLFGGWLTLAVLAPIWAVLALGVGRLVYPHTPRGRCRGRYHPAGWAEWHELRWGVAAHTMRRTAVAVRPQLAARVALPSGRTSAVALARIPAAEVGLKLGRVAIGVPFPTCCYAAHQDTLGIVAPPQSLKTALMGHHILDHPGAVLSTQTKPGTYHDTAALRRRRAVSGRVELLDPEGLTGDESTFRWSPVTGCADPRVAQQNAIALALAADSEDGGAEGHAWFAAKAATILRAFLFIADLTEHTMADVYLWAAGGQRHAQRAVALMEDHEQAMPTNWLDAMRGAFDTEAKKTRDSIMQVLEGAVAFMGDPAAAAVCLPGPNDPVFDVASFLADRGTVYLIASDRPYAKVGPLLAAFTTSVFEEAKRLAARYPNGRLDPTLLLSLDEVALTIPMPLDRWLADAGGRGITIEWSAQSASQLRQRWGDDGADTVWNATTVKLIAGGLTVIDDLRAFSQLCGERRDTDTHGKDLRPEKVMVLSVDELRCIPPWHALMLHRTTRATMLRIKPVWLRRDVLAARLRDVALVAARRAPVVAAANAPALPAPQADREEVKA